MHATDLLRFATTALRGHRLRTGLSLVGVAIGVASVVLLTSLGEGARRYVVGEFSSLGTNLLIVLPGKTETSGAAPVMGGAPNDLTVEDTVAIAREIPEVRWVAPLTVGSAAVSYGELSRQATIAGTTWEMLPVRKLKVRSGRYLPEGDRDSRICVIGPTLERELFRGRNPLGQIVRIGEERFRVVGVMAPRGRSLGLDMDELVHVPVDRGLALFDRTTLFRGLIEVRSHDEIETARRQVLDLLIERHGEEDVTVITQDAVVETFGRILGVLTAALSGIAAVSLSVAGIGIMNVMLVSVSERTREIGLLMALGASRAQVLAVFLVEATCLSILGGGVGLAVGSGAARTLRAVYPAFPASPPTWAVAAALLVSLAVGVGFGMLPARRAARLDPVAALAGR